MNDLVVQNQSGVMTISPETEDLICAGVADNTPRAYRRVAPRSQSNRCVTRKLHRNASTRRGLSWCFWDVCRFSGTEGRSSSLHMV